ncbi:MAG: 30S ribosomal protein S9 [Omnitrophica bacterium RIFCSPLOWO2_12_FULL_50_11]|nr:MAG: 30S ribosomal protein S9 [Omnitrophica bacterium RIFCSPLOWO2_12_FULL_50_11]
MVEEKSANDSNRFYATGRRKTSIARVWLEKGGKEILVNDAKLESYFPRETLRTMIQEPFELTKTSDQFGLKVYVHGGGLSGQAGAVRLGISRALLEFDQNLRPLLRKSGLLTRDPRKKERKKYGRKGARRSFQYTKR